MGGGRATDEPHFSGIDAAIEALTTRSSFDLPFAPALHIEHGEDASLFDHIDAWETTGADVAQRLLDAVIECNEPVTIIGGQAEDIAELKRRYGLHDVRWHCAPARLKHNPDAILAAADFAAAQESRFVFICVGAQQQKAIAYAIAHRAKGRGVGLCVGAPLDAISGRAARAPPWMRELGLEWLHRLVSEPRP